MPQDENKRVIETEQTRKKGIPNAVRICPSCLAFPGCAMCLKKGVVQKYYVQSGERVKPFP